MGIEADLQARLAAQVTLVSGRVYPLVLPQKAILPAVTFQRVPGGERPSAMVSDCGVVIARFQVDVWALSYGGVTGSVAVFEQVRAALQRWRKTVPVVVQDTFLPEPHQDIYEDDIGDKGGGQGGFRKSIDARIIYEE